MHQLLLTDQLYKEVERRAHVAGFNSVDEYFAEVVIGKPGTDAEKVASEFHKLAERWIRETSLMSNLTDICLHPAHQRIIGLGPMALPLILDELKQKPYHWFWALNALTGLDPTPVGASFHDARVSWLNWGREAGIIE